MISLPAVQLNTLRDGSVASHYYHVDVSVIAQEEGKKAGRTGPEMHGSQCFFAGRRKTVKSAPFSDLAVDFIP